MYLAKGPQPMLNRIRALIHRLQEAVEIEALTDRDLDDLGMSRAQLRDFLQMPQDITERVTAMGAIFGVPEAALRRDHAQWVELLSTCGHCADRGACAKVLANGSSANQSDAPFCGNRHAFDSLAPKVA
jgi:uncharacterized protein YjiS (DUF1127 family)